MYDWEVDLRNDRMGFQKSFRVAGERVTDAIGAALFELKGKGYDPFDFSVIRVQRKGARQ